MTDVFLEPAIGKVGRIVHGGEGGMDDTTGKAGRGGGEKRLQTTGYR